MPSDSLANPVQLAPWRPKPRTTTSGLATPGTEMLQVIVETPRGSRNKYSFDEEQRLFVLKSTLPAGMVFPFDFGFVPGTRGGDDDPLDVLLLLEAPCFPGCAVLARPLGVLGIEQTRDGKTFRNDRLLAVADAATAYNGFLSLTDVPEQLLTEVEAFFLQYHRLQNKQSRSLGWQDARAAMTLIHASRTSSTPDE